MKFRYVTHISITYKLLVILRFSILLFQCTFLDMDIYGSLVPARGTHSSHSVVPFQIFPSKSFYIIAPSPLPCPPVPHNQVPAPPDPVPVPPGPVPAPPGLVRAPRGLVPAPSDPVPLLPVAQSLLPLAQSLLPLAYSLLLLGLGLAQGV
jgi:hypothetical protein